MKEIEIKSKEQTELTIEQEHKKQQKLIGKMALHPGHTLWEVDFVNGEIRAAEYEEIDVVGDLSKERIKGMKGKVIVKEGCEYIGALNKKNAAIKVMRRESGTRNKATFHPPVALAKGRN